ncbi:MAG: hypothetical protein HYZ54_06520 [Ignavibacteriae bacterium]|nr:hypothetical protein [Ignavibacteriota bacterium]
MVNYKGPTVIILILNVCTIIGAGHGILPLGVLEVFWLSSVLGSEQNLQQLAIVIVFVTLVGQISLLTALFMQEQQTIRRAQIIGTILLLFGFVFILGSKENEAGFITFILGIPFLYVSLKLMYKISSEN